MHKSLTLLGMLFSGPKTGYELDRMLRGHGDLYADLKKANVYYLLDRSRKEGYLDVQAEPGARGPRGERLIYSLTESGRARFRELLEQVLRTYEPPTSSIGAAICYLPHLPASEAISLLEERRENVAERRAHLEAHCYPQSRDGLIALAMDHRLALIDADLAWTDRALDRLRARERSMAADRETEAVG